ncbi:MAG: fumarylacetoacetate hydrolase family protein [Sphingobacteriales bacterium]|nr:fumarylacetoacetate hydrolase family protein [Sphingobacteriales bacterium]
MFCKPLTALLLRGQPFYYPDFSTDIHYEGELVIQICKNGKNVEPRFSCLYYDKITVGSDFTARDLQTELKQNTRGNLKKAAQWLGAAQGNSLPIRPRHNNPAAILRLAYYKMVGQFKTVTQIICCFRLVQLLLLSKYFILQQSDINILRHNPARCGPIPLAICTRLYWQQKTFKMCHQVKQITTPKLKCGLSLLIVIEFQTIS